MLWSNGVVVVSAQVAFAAAGNLLFWRFSILRYPNVLHLNAGGFCQLGSESLNFSSLLWFCNWVIVIWYDNAVETIYRCPKCMELKLPRAGSAFWFVTIPILSVICIETFFFSKLYWFITKYCDISISL